MKRKLFQRRFPTYFIGASLGLILVLFVSQMKKAFAPEFSEFSIQGEAFSLEPGAPLFLDLGNTPGHFLAWGFPTKLALGIKNAEGKITPLQFFEYKTLVEPQLKLGAFLEEGAYEITGQFYACAKPGEKYCINLKLKQEFLVKAGGEKEKKISLAVRELAEKASKEGNAKEAQNNLKTAQ